MVFMDMLGWINMMECRDATLSVIDKKIVWSTMKRSQMHMIACLAKINLSLEMLQDSSTST